eukprot:g1892.t1
MVEHATAAGDGERVVARQEVAKHTCFTRGKEDVWVVLDLDERGQRVFDVSHYLDEHPGGADVFEQSAGKVGWEATDDFEEQMHSPDAKIDAERYCIGRLEGGQHRDAAGALHMVGGGEGVAGGAAGGAGAMGGQRGAGSAGRGGDDGGFGPYAAAAAVVAIIAIAAMLVRRGAHR